MTQVFTIQELSAEVGGDVTPRTIRYYIAEGLLPKYEPQLLLLHNCEFAIRRRSLLRACGNAPPFVMAPDRLCEAGRDRLRVRRSALCSDAILHLP